jgi:hypothetical protein
MASLNQIVYNLANAANDATNTVLLERLKFMVEYYRALFVRRDAERSFNLPDQFAQNLHYEMEWVSAVEACGVSLPCQILRTKELVPSPINLKGASGFLYVGAVEGQEGYQYVTQEQAPYSLFGKFSGTAPKYFYKNSRIYIVNSSAMCIDVKMVAESPVTGGLAGGGGVTCLSPEDEYPISMDMVARITEAIMAKELRAERPDDDEQVEIK